MGSTGGTRTEVRVDVALPRGTEAPALSRRALEQLRGALEQGVFEDLRLLVSELVGNSVRHVGMDCGSWVRLRVDLTPQVIRAEVRDPGRGFGPTHATQRPDAESGWGLYLLRALADRWGIRAAPTTVWFELQRRGRRGPAFASAPA